MTVVTRIRVWPRIAATAALLPVFLAGGNDGKPHYVDGAHYQAGVVSHPRFEASISFDDSGWSARAVPTVGAVGWKPAEPQRLDPLAALYWRDAAIEIDRVKDGLVMRRLTGTVAEATVRDGALVITCADLSNRLDKPFASATFAGTGGIEGGESAAGRPKRRSFGCVWNVEGRLLDQANNIYEFGDPSRPLFGFAALRDKGRAGPLGIVAWQGSIDATLNALRAAQPARGGGVAAPSIACAKWWTQPAGPLTADLRGEAAGYSEDVVGIAAQLLAAVGGPPITDLDGAMDLRPARAGLHIGDTSETTASALDRLLQRVTLLWKLGPLGQIDILPWTFSDPVEVLNAQFIGREKTLQPVRSRQVGYKRNERQHGDGEIAIDLLAEDVVYEDGSTAEDWKPADKGATKGAPDGTDVGDITVEDVVGALKAIGLTSDPAEVVAGAQALADAMKELALATDPAEIVAGAKALVDRARSADMAALEQLVLNQERKERFDALTHMDGTPVGAKVRQEQIERVTADEALATRSDLIEAVMGDNHQAALAAIEQEATARVTADAAETLARETAISLFRTEVGQEFTEVAASIESEAQTRADAIAAETLQRETAISNLQTTVNGQISVVTAAIAAEAVTRADAIAAETQQRELAISNFQATVDGQFTEVEASIAAEALTRATAISAETTQRQLAISELETATGNAISAAIAAEATTRADQISAETAQREAAISTLSGDIGDVSAALVTEQTTRSTADAAETLARQQAVSALSDDVADVAAAISAEATTRATAISAETLARETAISTLRGDLEGDIADVSAAIVAEAATRATAISAETSQREAAISALETSTGDAIDAAIAAEAVTRANAISAETLQREAAISALETATGNALTAAIASEASTRATAISAETSARETALSSLDDDLRAYVAGEVSTLVSADTAMAVSISGISTTLGGHTASIEALSESVDGVLLRYGLKLDSNGHIVGFLANNNGYEGGFDFVADYFRIWDADGTINQAVFAYDSGVLKMSNVEVDTIKAGTGNSAQFGGASAGTVVTGAGMATVFTVLTKTVTLLRPGSIQATAAIALSYAGTPSNSSLQLRIGGSTVFSVGGATTEISVVLAGFNEGLPAGTYDVEILFAGPSNMSVAGRNLSTVIIYS